MRSRSLVAFPATLRRGVTLHATRTTWTAQGGSSVRRIARVVSLGLLAALLIAAPVAAAQPLMERIELDDQFVNPFLSDACGVEVTMHLTGHLTFRLFSDADGDPVSELDNFVIHIRSWTVYGEIHANNVHLDRVTTWTTEGRHRRQWEPRLLHPRDGR
jgi:hypothetical protein